MHVFFIDLQNTNTAWFVCQNALVNLTVAVTFSDVNTLNILRFASPWKYHDLIIMVDAAVDIFI